jgi:hypothetical protein
MCSGEISGEKMQRAFLVMHVGTVCEACKPRADMRSSAMAAEAVAAMFAPQEQKRGLLATLKRSLKL